MLSSEADPKVFSDKCSYLAPTQSFRPRISFRDKFGEGAGLCIRHSTRLAGAWPHLERFSSSLFVMLHPIGNDTWGIAISSGHLDRRNAGKDETDTTEAMGGATRQ